MSEFDKYCDRAINEMDKQAEELFNTNDDYETSESILPTTDTDGGTSNGLRKRNPSTFNDSKTQSKKKIKKKPLKKLLLEYFGILVVFVVENSIILYERHIKNRLPENWIRVNREEGTKLPNWLNEVNGFFKYNTIYIIFAIIVFTLLYTFLQYILLIVAPLFQLYKKSEAFLLLNDVKVYNVFDPNTEELLNRYRGTTSIDDTTYLDWLDEIKPVCTLADTCNHYKHNNNLLLPLNDNDFINRYFESHIYLDSKIYNISFDIIEYVMASFFEDKTNDVLCYHSVEFGLTRNVLMIKDNGRFKVLYDPFISDYSSLLYNVATLSIDSYFPSIGKIKLRLPKQITLEYKNKDNLLERIKLKDELNYCAMFYLFNFNSMEANNAEFDNFIIN